MVLLIHSLQAVQRQVCVDLSGRDIGVAEDGLHGAQVGSVFYHVRGAGMA